jgi:hypothetical protein
MAPPTGGAVVPQTALDAPAPWSKPAKAAAAPPAPPQTPAGAGRVRFNPPQADTTMSSSFAVALVLDGASDVTEAPIQLSFDPKMLRIDDVMMGDLVGADGQQPVFSKSIENDAGQATIQLHRPQGASGITAPSGALVFLSFQAIGRGATTVNAPNMSVRNSQGKVVAAGNPQLVVSIK